MATSLGIQLRADGFAWVLLEGSAKKPALKSSGRAGFPSAAATPKELGKVLAAEIGLRKADHLTVTVPSPRVVMRELSLPFQEREKVLQVLKYEVESELYHLAVEDVVADFIPLETERATPALLVGVAPKKHVAQAIELAAGAGWDPHAVQASYGCYASALALTAPRLAGTPEAEAGEAAAPEEDAAAATALAFAHFGPDETLLAVVGPGGRLRAARALPLGWLDLLHGVELPQAAQGEVILPDGKAAAAAPAEAEADKAVKPGKGGGAEGGAAPEAEEGADAAPQGLFGGAPDARAGVDFKGAQELAGSDRARELCKRLANEIRRGLAAMPAAGAAELRLTGDLLPGIEEALTARIGMPARRLRRGPDLIGGDDGLMIALGAALEGFGAAPAPMNFRQEEFRYARGLERVEGPLTLALVGLIAWLVIDAGVHLKTGIEIRRKADTVYLAADKRVADLNQRVLEDADYPDDWAIKNDMSGAGVSDGERIALLDSRVKAAVRQIDELMGQSDLEMPPSCLEAWRLLMLFLEKELQDYPEKWMIESFDLTAVDRSRSGSGAPPHVEAKFGLTLKSDDAARVAATFDRIDRGLREQPWCVDAPTIPSTEAAKVGPGKTAVITVKIAGREAAAEERK